MTCSCVSPVRWKSHTPANVQFSCYFFLVIPSTTLLFDFPPPASFYPEGIVMTGTPLWSAVSLSEKINIRKEKRDFDCMSRSSIQNQ